MKTSTWRIKSHQRGYLTPRSVATWRFYTARLSVKLSREEPDQSGRERSDRQSSTLANHSSEPEYDIPEAASLVRAVFSGH